MNAHPYSTLVRYKQWADRGLYEVAAGSIDRLDAAESSILLRILDHIHVVDRIFQHHLQGVTPPFRAPRSDALPTLDALARDALEVDAWYVDHVGRLSAAELDEPLVFAYTNGSPARMTRGEIILHVCMHGTYHRGNAGLLLQKNGIQPNDDRMTDFVDQGRGAPSVEQGRPDPSKRLAAGAPAMEAKNPA
jgi:uncharacterized damage-inducible protein DinB